MTNITGISRTVAAMIALSALAGCANQTPSSSAAVSTADPELAGAWYQIYFDTNGADINDRGTMIVNTVAFVSQNAGPTRVTVIGKTDRVGAPSQNMALSQRRADKVRDALTKAGVPADSIETSWTGETRQAVSTLNGADEPRNRVVDVTVVKLEN